MSFEELFGAFRPFPIVSKRFQTKKNIKKNRDESRANFTKILAGSV
jgi:hypothetical protein